MGEFGLSIIKFCASILLLPVVMASAVTLRVHLGQYPISYDEFFLWGSGCFLLTFLFVYQFWGVYEFGQKIMESLLTVFAPFNRFIAYLLPFFVILVVLLFFLTTQLFNTHKADQYFIFFVGFFMSMHILLTAQDLQQIEKTPVKPHYLFTMTCIFIFNAALIVLLLDVIVGKLTILSYAVDVWASAKTFYMLGIDKLILFK